VKLHPDPLLPARHVVTAYDPGRIIVGAHVLTRSLWLMPERFDPTWGPDDFAALDVEHLAVLVAQSCDLVLLGTGRRQRFPAAALLRPLIDSGRGFEIMDTAAACRTYNLLVAEGRMALAALIVEREAA